MFCTNCGETLSGEAKFCEKCGSAVKTDSAIKADASPKEPASADQVENREPVIKCGNCGYTGEGQKNRSLAAQILAWICVLFAPLITLVYFLATHKYRCPKCKSTFLGIKNKEGVFVGQKGSNNGVSLVIFILVGIAIIGILSSVVLASLNAAREKAREASLNTSSTGESLSGTLKDTEEYLNSVYSLPAMIDEETRFDRVYASYDNKMNYDYTLVNYAADELDWATIESAILPDIKKGFCGDSTFEFYRENNVPMRWNYYGMNGGSIGSIELTNKDCL